MNLLCAAICIKRPLFLCHKGGCSWQVLLYIESSLPGYYNLTGHIKAHIQLGYNSFFEWYVIPTYHMFNETILTKWWKDLKFQSALSRFDHAMIMGVMLQNGSCHNSTLRSFYDLGPWSFTWSARGRSKCRNRFTLSTKVSKTSFKIMKSWITYSLQSKQRSGSPVKTARTSVDS